VHGTAATPAEAWGWGYQRQLTHDGFGVCTVTLPRRSLGDFTVSAEYAVYAARQAYRRSGNRKIALVGHSQGGAMAVWIAKFWPDIARHASDIVSIAGPLNGTTVANGLCAAGRCAVVAWQLRKGAHTSTALVNAPKPRGLAITSIATRLDELITPQPAASTMRGARTILVQDICPGRLVEHGLLLGDPAAYALTVDAMTHRGTADERRIDRAVCSQPLLSEADPVGAAGFVTTALNFVNGLLNPLRWVAAEPPLPSYADRYSG
jgi:pimeloyl-ACP methyl ester carboxylesterase